MTREELASLIDGWAANADPMRMRDVAQERPGEGGIPVEMQVGRVDDEGWVSWKVLPSSVTDADVDALADSLQTSVPDIVRAWLRARHHAFDQLFAATYKQLVIVPPVLTSDALRETARHLTAWAPLLAIDYFPLAEWGDGWGPVCIDRAGGDDGPVVWFEHELLSDGRPVTRSAVEPLAQPLYPSATAFFRDLRM